MENLPIFATAIILGNMAGLKKEGISGLNGFAAIFLAVRAIYTATYANHTAQGLTWLRTGLYFTGFSLCLRIMVKSAKALNMPKLGL
jgi:uncharacterized MAPEG superfamily protein